MSTISSVRIDQPYSLALDTNNALNDATATNILYRKPDGTTGTLTGSVSDTSIIASVTGAINDQAGLWCFHTTAIFSGDTNATIGELFTLRVKDLWTK